MAEHKATHKSIDIDNEPDAAEKYEIKALPTVIALKDGEVVGTKVGALSPDQLDKWVSGILKD